MMFVFMSWCALAGFLAGAVFVQVMDKAAKRAAKEKEEEIGHHRRWAEWQGKRHEVSPGVFMTLSEAAASFQKDVGVSGTVSVVPGGLKVVCPGMTNGDRHPAFVKSLLKDGKTYLGFQVGVYVDW